MRGTVLSLMAALVAGGLSSIVLVAPGLAGEDCCTADGSCKREQKIEDKAVRKGDRVERKTEKRVEKRMDKIESFTFHQSGGFIGMEKSYSVKLADMNADEREKLEGLIKDSGLLETKGEERITKGAADMFVYQFSVNDGTKTREITFDDGTLPAAYRPIVEFSKEKLVDNRRR